jgi:hypothetical protein
MNPLQNTNLQQLVISLVVILLTVVILPGLRTWLKSRSQNEQSSLLYGFIEELVKAAEQMFKPGMTLTPEALNAVKKDYVMREAVAFAHRFGIPITREQLEALVEAAVYGMKQWGRPMVVAAE